MAQDNKTLLLTGASGGIGRAIIPVLAQAGYKLILQANTRADDLSDFLKAQNIQNTRIIQQSLASADDVAQLHSSVKQPVDILVANAGISRSAPAHKLRIDDWQKTLDINLSVPFYLAKTFFPDMRARQFGRIIFISSVVATTFVRGTAAYAASKAGLSGLARALAADWAPFGITVNCIAPGYMDSGMIGQIPEPLVAAFKDKSVQNRLGPSEEIGHAITYLSSEKSSYITGHTLHLNGGIV